MDAEFAFVEMVLSEMQSIKAPITTQDLEDLDCDTVFLLVELSDAIRRGVKYFSLKGDEPLTLDGVINALIEDGEICFDDECAEEPVAH